METVSRRKALWIELGVVLSLFWLPNLVNGLAYYFASPLRSPFRLPFDLTALLTGSTHLVGAIAAVLFIAWVSGDGLAAFGIRRLPWWQVLSATLATFIAIYLVMFSLEWSMHTLVPEFYKSERMAHMTLRPQYDYRSSPALVTVHFAFSSFAEELIMRAYLITRLRELTGKMWIGVFVSTALFAVYHIYQGQTAVVSVFGVGLALAVSFTASRSIWPAALAHWAIDIYIALSQVAWF